MSVTLCPRNVCLTKTSCALYPLWQMELGMRGGEDDKMAAGHPHERVNFIYQDVSLCVLKLRNVRCEGGKVV